MWRKGTAKKHLHKQENINKEVDNELKENLNFFQFIIWLNFDKIKITKFKYSLITKVDDELKERKVLCVWLVGLEL